MALVPFRIGGGLEAFQTTGYLYAPGLFPPERIAMARAAFSEVVPATLAAPLPMDAWIAAQTRLLSDPRVTGLAAYPALETLVQSLIGPFRAHCGDIARIMAPGAATRPHQDAAYTKRTDGLTVWIALEDTPVERGTLVLVADAHEGRLLPHGPGEEGIAGEFVWIGNDLAAGDAVLFSALTVHAALPNRSRTTRVSVDLRFWPETERDRKR